MLRFAAIDVGSNAVRLLLSNVIEEPGSVFFKKISLIRMPVRLGAAVFTDQEIPAHKEEKLLQTFIGFRHFINAFDPLDYRACATSAMREARNGVAVAERIYRESGIRIDIIDGSVEADLIYANYQDLHLQKYSASLMIDVGGGSCELSYIVNGDRIRSRSFPIGTVRLLKNMVKKEDWQEMKDWLKSFHPGNTDLIGIGSGGNINKIARLTGLKEGNGLSYKNFREMASRLEKLSMMERIQVFNLRPDRADVIVPASTIYLNAMKWSGIQQIFIPQIGLTDGIVHSLYDSYKQRTASE